MSQFIPIAKPLIGEAEKQKVCEVLDSGFLAQGSQVLEFEKQFSSYIGTDYGVACSSCTTALHLALMVAGVSPGDRVLTTPFTFIATSNAILYCGAQPVFCDIDPLTYNLDPKKIRESLENIPGIKALLLVHLYGLPAPMEEILAITREKGIILIEDCAQAHGATFKGKKAGSFGKLSVFSFYPTKNITTGEGGMVLSSDPEMAKAARILREHGTDKEYYYENLGYNYRMTNLAAAIGLEQLKKLEQFNAARRENAAFYLENFKDLPDLVLPVIPPDCRPVFHQFTLRIKNNRDAFCNYLKENQVGYKVFYPVCIHRQPFYQKLGYGKFSFPQAELAAQQVCSIPVHPALGKGDLTRVVEVIREYFKKV